jgi:hypothetical protein
MKAAMSHISLQHLVPRDLAEVIQNKQGSLWYMGSFLPCSVLVLATQSFCRYGWVAAAMKNISNKNTGGLYFTSVYCNSQGLSCNSADFLSHIGVGLSAKTFLHQMKSCVALYRTAVLTILLSWPHILWVDNKGYWQLMLYLDIGSFHRINATAVVLVLLDLPSTIPALCHLSTADITPQVLSCDLLTVFLKHFNNFNNSNIPAIQCFPQAQALQQSAEARGCRGHTSICRGLPGYTFPVFHTLTLAHHFTLTTHFCCSWG